MVDAQTATGAGSSVVVRGIQAAASSACASIAASARRSPEDVKRQLSPAVRWLIAQVDKRDGRALQHPPPILAQQCVDRLRSHLVSELAGCEGLQGGDVVRAMSLLEQLSDAWKQTDRGRFMACLTGSESASALVAIAHDLRSPLSSILILVDSLRRGRGSVKDPIQERQLGLIYGATQGLAALASDLIDAARGEELLVSPPRPFSLAETIHSVQAIVQPIAEEKGLLLVADSPDIDARVGHAAPLHRVLLNLVCNALRYTDEGSVTIGCRETSPTCVEFWVQDTGHGLPAKVQENLFDAFLPERMSLRFSSSGLGLATVRALLRVMNGKLKVETAPDTGTRLSFELILPPSPRT